ncbi:hypothetical protein RHSIM_Rhsim12G0202500 [Rhododendron simsii]|uniref:Avr9/Cf-9 rapidly elicited protein 146 n=1 Tax=Rhododendron simsii TaxID=118357 RepID=A0A834G7S3_RHOSS|nr:hypothetical protein RHSIM_Rhsim12G0202500 [Rhododendron simsii]
MLKRGKIAGKAAILNLMLHHHHSAASDRLSQHNGHLSFRAPHDEYEFSCSNSPAVSFPFHLGKRNKRRSGACDDHPPEVEDDVATAASAVEKVLEMPGFGVVRQLRITDSPSPLPKVGGVDGHVDEAAEDFIVRFYNDVVAKKLWNLVRVMYDMLRKGISKGKLIVNLNTMLKRGKIAGKAAMLNLMLHHHHSTAASDCLSQHDGHLSFRAPHDEYEFSCSNSPVVSFPFHLGKRNKRRSGACDDHAPEVEDDVATAASAVEKVLEMPGFGVVRQLGITDSPSPLPEVVDVEGQVDAAAEDYIVRFYNDLRKQNEKALR